MNQHSKWSLLFVPITRNLLLGLMLIFSVMETHARKRLPWNGLPENAEQRIFETVARANNQTEPAVPPVNFEIKDLLCSKTDRAVSCSHMSESSGKKIRKSINDSDFLLQYLEAKNLGFLEVEKQKIKIYRVATLNCQYQREQQPYYFCGNSSDPKLSK
jgi:hypothetical protein